MSFETLIIIFLSSLLLILVIIQFFFSNTGSKERIRILLEKQENLEKSIYQIFEEKFDKIDTKFEKSSAENQSNLYQIKEKISIIDRAQQNISGLTENVIDLKNILSNTTKRGKFGEVLLENLISDHLPTKNYEFQKINAEKIQEIERSKLSKHIVSAKKEVIDLIKKLRDKNVNGEDTRIIGKRLKEIETEHLTQKKSEKSISWKPKVGDFVKIKSLNSTGQIVDLDKKAGFYEIKCGSFRSTLSVNDFEGINGEKPNFKRSKIEIKSTREDFSFSKIRTSKNTIDVRGLRVHEAEIIIEEKIRKFHGPLWIVHGIGTGKLKKGLRNWLSGLNYVDKIEDAANNEGGPGCSIAWIK